MQVFLVLLLLIGGSASAPPPNLGIRLNDVKPRIDQLLKYVTNRDPRQYEMHEWRLPGYPQADTGFRAFVDDGGYITGLGYQFYLGFDAEREEHYKQSLPVLRGLFDIFLPSLELTEEQIHRHLQRAKAEGTPVRLTDSKLAATITYRRFDSPEELDRYRSFVVEIYEAQRRWN